MVANLQLKEFGTGEKEKGGWEFLDFWNQKKEKGGGRGLPWKSLLVILMVIAIGFIFGFGIFADGFEKMKNSLHYDVPQDENFGGRPFYYAPPPF